jgi:AraC-like DNA-binding protein
MVAARSGFGSPGQMARAFKRTLGVAPSEYAALHGRRRVPEAKAGVQ